MFNSGQTTCDSDKEQDALSFWLVLKAESANVSDLCILGQNILITVPFECTLHCAGK